LNKLRGIFFETIIKKFEDGLYGSKARQLKNLIFLGLLQQSKVELNFRGNEEFSNELGMMGPPPPSI